MQPASCGACVQDRPWALRSVRTIVAVSRKISQNLLTFSLWSPFSATYVLANFLLILFSFDSLTACFFIFGVLVVERHPALLSAFGCVMGCAAFPERYFDSWGGGVRGGISKLRTARSRVYLSRFLHCQVNPRWKAFEEIYNIYKIYILSQRSDLKNSDKFSKIRPTFLRLL